MIVEVREAAAIEGHIRVVGWAEGFSHFAETGREAGCGPEVRPT